MWADPDGSTQPFEFDTSYGPNFSLVDGGENDSGPLVPGTYSVDELTPAGWEETSAVCSDGSDPLTIGLDPGETVRCIFENEQDAQITLVKQTLNGEAGAFEVVTSYAGTVVLDVPNDPDHNSGPLDPGTYSAAETVPTGWLLVDSFCSDDSDPGAIGLQAGEHVICTFVNERQIGSIDITKVRKHAAEGPGDHPHERVTFTVSGPSGSFDVVTDADGHACVDRLDFGTYTVTEHNPGGYADNDPQNVDVNTVDYCASRGGGGAASFSNTPLTDLTVEVNSQVDGGTASTVTCTPDGPSGSTDAVGDCSGTTTDLAPGTYTCVIVIDP